MLVTAEVSKLERSSDASDEQPSNMELMSLTFDVFHFDTSREVSDEQP